MEKIYLSVVVPCYNEAKNLEKGSLEKIKEYLDKQKYSWEVLVCDDGSTDNSREIVEKFEKANKGFKLLKLAHGGKPSAIYGGVKAAKGEILLFTDMDQSTPIKEIEKLLPWFDKKYEVVIGSRGLKREGFNMTRKVASVVFRYVRGAFVLPNIIDTQCGFKAVKNEVVKEIFPKLSYFETKDHGKGWIVSAYDAEMLFIADKWGYKIKEIPVIWKDEDVSTTKNRSASRFFKESMKMAKEITNIVSHNLKGAYKK